MGRGRSAAGRSDAARRHGRSCSARRDQPPRTLPRRRPPRGHEPTGETSTQVRVLNGIRTRVATLRVEVATPRRFLCTGPGHLGRYAHRGPRFSCGPIVSMGRSMGRPLARDARRSPARRVAARNRHSSLQRRIRSSFRPDASDIMGLPRPDQLPGKPLNHPLVCSSPLMGGKGGT